MSGNAQSGFVVWLTGMSGAGKSTIANALAAGLRDGGQRVEILDGDVVRAHLGQGLGFSREDRNINIQRIGYVANLLARNGVAVIVAAISPYRQARDAVRAEIPCFMEVYVRCSLDELVRRDTKGLYAGARRGQVANLTGVSDPYEEPLAPEVIVQTDRESLSETVSRILHATHALVSPAKLAV